MSSRSVVREDKPRWRDVPKSAREAVATRLGVRVRRGARAWGGYAPSPTFRLRLDDGGGAFAKGCWAGLLPTMREMFRRELRIYAELGDTLAGWAPAFRGQVRADGWEFLLLEDLGPKSAPPWSRRLARSVMRSFGAFHATTRDTALPDWIERPGAWLDRAHLWAPSRRRSEGIARWMPRVARAEASSWLAAVRPALASAARRLLRAEARPQLLHADLRSDNLRWLDGRLRLLDWPTAVAGPPEFDVAFFAQSVTVECGIDPDGLIAWYHPVNPLDRETLDAAVCAVAGFFADQAWRPEVPGLPRLRAFQRKQLFVSLPWAIRRLGLQMPGWLAESIPHHSNERRR